MYTYKDYRNRLNFVCVSNAKSFIMLQYLSHFAREAVLYIIYLFLFLSQQYKSTKMFINENCVILDSSPMAIVSTQAVVAGLCAALASVFAKFAMSSTEAEKMCLSTADLMQFVSFLQPESSLAWCSVRLSVT